MSDFTPKDIIAKINEMEEMHKELKLMGLRISDHLGVEEVPFEFVELKDEESRVELKPSPKILISERYLRKYDYAAYCLAHEYRHAFQLYWVNLMNDNLAKVWKEELQDAKNSENIDSNNKKEYTEYKLQAIEIDAEAFAIYYLRTFEGVNIRRKEEWFQNLIEVYIKKYGDRL